jgi:hypothetical protein
VAFDRREQNTERRSPRAVLVVVAGLVIALGSVSPSAAEQSDGWDYRVTLYMLGAAQSGPTTIRGMDTDIDMSFSDIWSNEPPRFFRRPNYLTPATMAGAVFC